MCLDTLAMLRSSPPLSSFSPVGAGFSWVVSPLSILWCQAQPQWVRRDYYTAFVQVLPAGDHAEVLVLPLALIQTVPYTQTVPSLVHCLFPRPGWSSLNWLPLCGRHLLYFRIWKNKKKGKTLLAVTLFVVRFPTFLFNLQGEFGGMWEDMFPPSSLSSSLFLLILPASVGKPLPARGHLLPPGSPGTASAGPAVSLLHICAVVSCRRRNTRSPPSSYTSADSSVHI